MPLFDPKYEVENLMRDRAAACRSAGWRAKFRGDAAWADARARQALCLKLGAALAGYGDVAGAVEFAAASEQFVRGDGDGGWNNGLAGFDGVDDRDAMDGLEGLDGFFKKLGNAVKKVATKTVVGKVVSSVVKVAAAPVTAAVRIAQDVKSKGIVGAIKAVPSRVLYGPIKDATKGVTALTTMAGKNTVVGKIGQKTDKAVDKADKWTQKHPLETIGAAALAVGAVVAAPVVAGAVASAASAVGGAAASAAGAVASAGSTLLGAGGAAGAGGLLSTANTVGTMLSVAAPMLGAGSKPPVGPIATVPNMGTAAEQAMGTPGAPGGVANYTTVKDPQGNAYAIIDGNYYAIDPVTGQQIPAPQAGMASMLTNPKVLLGGLGALALLAMVARR